MRVRVPGKESTPTGWVRSKRYTEAGRDPATAPYGSGRGGTEIDDETYSRDRLKGYLLSLPERVVRSASAVSAGLLREIGEVTLPGPVRETNLYRNMVEATLRFLIEQVGEVEGAYPLEGKLSEDFAVRRAAGNGIELAGILAFRASPVWVMAALADLSGTGRQLIHEISDALKQEKLLNPGEEFETVDHILDGLEKTSSRVAGAVNTPPLDVAGLRREWAGIRDEVKAIPPPNRPSAERLWNQWKDLRSVAAQQGLSVFQLSSVMAMSAMEKVPDRLRWLSRSAPLAARRTGEVFAGPLLDHYSQTLSEIREVGFLTYWRKQFPPYLRAAAAQFSREHASLTERFLERGPKG